MKKLNLLYSFGVLFIVLGFGGGLESTLWKWSNAYRDMAMAGGSARPSELAFELSEAIRPLTIGIPIGLLGVVLIAWAIRGYLQKPG